MNRRAFRFSRSIRTGLAVGRLLLPALALALAMSVASGFRANAKVFDPNTFTLDNGMQVVVVVNDRAPIVSHMVWYKVGAADEPPGKSGIAHFLEHLLFKGTDTLAPGEASDIIARNGGRENAFTSWDYTGYFQNVAKDRLDLVMGLEADRMVNLRLSEDVVLPELEVILEERRSRVDNNPGAQLGEAINAALYMNHPYGIPIIGWEHEMRGLTMQDALDFYEDHYAPNNAILLVAGDVTVDEVRALAEKHYGVIPARDIPERVRPTEPPQLADRRVVLESPRVRQPSWRRVWLAPSYTTGETQHVYALQVLSEVIGGGATSDLYRNLVIESTSASSAGAYYGADDLDHSTFTVYASPLPGQNTPDDMATLESAVEAEIQRILRDGVAVAEVERAVKRLQSAAIFARDSLSTGVRVLGAALTTGQQVADVEAWPERIGSVTAEQVNEAARFIFQDRASVTGVLLPEPAS